MKEIITVNCPLCHSLARYDFSSRDLMFDLYERYDYYGCTNCQAVFQYPMPTMEKIASFYPEDYSIFDQKSRARKVSQFKQSILQHKYGYSQLKPVQIYKFLAPLFSLFYSMDKPYYIENGKLLDVGCGNGRYLSTMQSLGWNVQGVELSENGVKVCRKLELPVHHGDLSSARFDSNSFDVITVRHVIEHIHDPHSLIAELARILKPNGKLMIETPNSNALGRKFFATNWFANEVPRHLILFSPDNLCKLASEYDLNKVEISFDTTPKIILNSLDYVTQNKGKKSNKVRWKRSLCRLYMWCASYTGRGDIIHSVFTK